MSRSGYLEPHSLYGIPWWAFLFLIGARGRGKSYYTEDQIFSHIQRYGVENVKVHWCRCSELSIKKMLQKKDGTSFFDIDLLRKYNLLGRLKIKGQTIYIDGHPVVEAHSLVQAGKEKGVSQYDKDFLPQYFKDGKKRFIFIIIDEFQVDSATERATIGDEVEEFRTIVENTIRDTELYPYRAVQIIGCANSCSDCSDFTSRLFNFSPDSLGLFKLKNKKAIIWNMSNSEEYNEKQRKSLKSLIMDQDSANYTNELHRDMTCIDSSHRHIKPMMIIKFSAKSCHWFVLWDTNHITRYNKQTVKIQIPMVRHLDCPWNDDMRNTIIDLYDRRMYWFDSMITQSIFKFCMKRFVKAK